MEEQLDFQKEDFLYISAKEGTNLHQVFDAIIERIEPPKVQDDDPDKELLKCFLFDARYTGSRGVACFIKVMTHKPLDLNQIQRLISFHSTKRYEIYEIGVVQPKKLVPTGALKPGQVGYFLSNMKSVSDAHVGDTFHKE